MTVWKHVNFGVVELISDNGTSIEVDADTVTEWPSLDDGARMSLVISDGEHSPEIVYITGRVGGVLSVSRAQEGTTQRVWDAGSLLFQLPTASVLAQIAPNDSVYALKDLSNVDMDDYALADLSNVDTDSFALADLSNVTDRTISSSMIALNAITEDELFAGAVYTEALQDYCVTAGKLAQSILPVGSIMMYAGSSVPSGSWMECNGAAILRSTFSALFSAIGTIYGVGDGSTTFNIPDLRGVFVRGYDNGRGVDSGRVLGSNQDQSIQNHIHTITRLDGSGGSNGLQSKSSGASVGPTNTDADATAETRPRNTALMFIIKVV